MWALRLPRWAGARLPWAATALAALCVGQAAEAGSLKRDLRAALQTHRPALERCYDRELKRAEPATGTVVIRMVVKKNGKVARTRLTQASEKQAPVAKCLAAKLKRVRLPKQRARVAVDVPLRLHAS